MSVELLRSILQEVDLQRARPLQMPVDELRFTIELAVSTDVASLRAQLTQILGAREVTLERLFGSGPASLQRFFLLRLPGVERTLPADMLFEVAYALATALRAVSVEPDLGSRFYEQPAPAEQTDRQREVATAVRRWCNADEAPPVDRLWALDAIKARAAWQHDSKMGAGIIVAQPDTGVVPTHSELGDGALDMQRAFNVLNPGQPPIDPLSDSMLNPGHGTATASVVVSRSSGTVSGVAPGARVAPIRCINDVTVFDAAPVARAVDHARRSGCHVITLSLGGMPSRALHAAIKAAVDEQLIVLASAGNCVKTVVWPARYDECIAIAGVNIHDAPWKGSCRGLAVDISAPAENVWKADPRASAAASRGVSAGQGTSFAAAIAAGVAALWLAHHGRDALIALARTKGANLQQLFRSALIQTARRPESWDSTLYGAGIIDALQVQQLPPEQILITRKHAAGTTSAEQLDALMIELGADAATTLPQDFQWNTYGLELVNVLMENHRRDSRAHNGAATEAGLRAYRPSRSLTQALQVTNSPVLQASGAMRGSGFGTAPKLPTTSGRLASNTLRILATNALSHTRESTQPMLTSREAARTLASKGGQIIAAGLEHLARCGTGECEREAQWLMELLDQDGRTAIAKLARGDAAALGAREAVSLEALVDLTGQRPALRVQDDMIDLNDPQIGTWRDALHLIQDHIPRLVQSVGRIDSGEDQVGTGFLIAEDLVMTNRHVVEEIAAPLPSINNPRRWLLTNTPVTIDFRREGGSPGQHRFAVREVVFAGPAPINDTPFLDFTKLDLAVLRIETRNADRCGPPPPLEFLEGDLETHNSADVLVIGFPGRPVQLPQDALGKLRQDVLAALRRLYGLYYGVKYLSPGKVIARPGQISGDDVSAWVLAHDASTLAGNSGSCVVRYGPRPAIIGLHFAGELERANYAHAMTRVIKGKHLPGELIERLGWMRE